MVTQSNYKYFIFADNNVSVVGTTGTLTLSFNDYSQRWTEFASQEEEIGIFPGNIVLSMIKPSLLFMELVINNFIYHRTAIIAYSMNKNKSTRKIKQVGDFLDFSPDQRLNNSFNKRLRKEFMMKKFAYNISQTLGEIKGESNLDGIYGALHYANFLNVCKGVPENQVRTQAFQRFHL